MTEDERIIKLGELLQSEAVLQQLSRANSKDDIRLVFSSNGLQMSEDEVKTFIRVMKLSCSDELDESDLELATGGSADALFLMNRAYKGVLNTRKSGWNESLWKRIV